MKHYRVTSTLKVPIYGAWRCSKCGKLNFSDGEYTISETASGAGGYRRASELRDRTMSSLNSGWEKNTRRLFENPAMSPYAFRRHVHFQKPKCAKCKNKEKWYSIFCYETKLSVLLLCYGFFALIGFLLDIDSSVRGENESYFLVVALIIALPIISVLIYKYFTFSGKFFEIDKENIPVLGSLAISDKMDDGRVFNQFGPFNILLELFANYSSIPDGNEKNDIVRTLNDVAARFKFPKWQAYSFYAMICSLYFKDEKAATKYHKIAADLGSGVSAYVYAERLENELGVEKNIDEAEKYYKISADLGYEDAINRFREAINQDIITRDNVELTKIEHFKTNINLLLEEAFSKVVNEYSISGDYIAELNNPNEFVKHTYDYCVEKHQDNESVGIFLEKCMISFYGAICLVLLWKDNKDAFSNADLWDLLNQKIDMEIIDSKAEELLGTEEGEEKADEIYEIITNYMDKVLDIVEDQIDDESVNLSVMEKAYELGLLVAIKEISNEELQSEIIDSDEKEETQEEDTDFESNVLFCRRCGCKLLSDSAFCYKCGTEVKIPN